jgi:hypothetical protein
MNPSEKTPTLVFIPCFSGAPWSAGQPAPCGDAPKTMLPGIPDAREVTLPRTGHMFRFSHPVTYAAAVRDFLATVPTARQAARA